MADDPTGWRPALPLPLLSRVGLDALLQELLARVGEVMSRERLRALLDAVVGIGSDLAAGMQLQGVARLSGQTDVQSRIDRVVNDLDTTIRDIRGAIFELRGPGRAPTTRSCSRRCVNATAACAGRTAR